MPNMLLYLSLFCQITAGTLLSKATTSLAPPVNGNFGTFIPATAPAPQATGGPTKISQQQGLTMLLACQHWVADTQKVSHFLDVGGKLSQSNLFIQQATQAFNAETEELTQKAKLDAIIGNNPTVSIANLTLTDGSFQSVLDNLKAMMTRGPSTAGLISTINKVRCPQILPAIDSYCSTAAKIANNPGIALKAVRPEACQQTSLDKED